MIVTILTGGTFVFTQMASVSESPQKVQVKSENTAVSVSLNKKSLQEFEDLTSNVPFRILLPSEETISKNELTGAFLNNIKGKSEYEKDLSLFYKTSQGNVHIWQSNSRILGERNNYLKNLGSELGELERVKINNHSWIYDKVLNIFTTQMNGTTVRVSGELSKGQLINIVTSLN